MDIKNIEAFLMVVEKGSFSVAAETLYISQPTISSRIQRLEQEAGAMLFERRGGKKAELSKFGKEIHPYFKEGFRWIQDGMAKVYDPKIEKVIKISFPNHIGQVIMPGVLKMLNTKFPDFKFEVKFDVISKILIEIQDMDTDVGLIYHDKTELDLNQDMISVVMITKEQTLLVASPDHPFAQKEHITVSDLLNEQIIIYTKTFVTNNIINKFFKENSVNEYKTLDIRNLESMKTMVKHGTGVSFLQHHIVREELENKTLITLKLDQPLPLLSVFLLIRKTVPYFIKDALIETTRKLFIENKE